MSAYLIFVLKINFTLGIVLKFRLTFLLTLENVNCV